VLLQTRLDTRQVRGDLQAVAAEQVTRSLTDHQDKIVAGDMRCSTQDSTARDL
jgi:hypothetical protein